MTINLRIKFDFLNILKRSICRRIFILQNITITTQTATPKKSDEQIRTAEEHTRNFQEYRWPETKLVLATTGIPHLPGWSALSCNVTLDLTFYRFNHKEVLITGKKNEDISPCNNR